MVGSTLRCFAMCLGILTLAGSALAQPGWVLSHRKINDTHGGSTGTLDDGDSFGTSVASLGDLDDDGVGDLAVGAPGDGDGGTVRGAVWVLFLDTDGTVLSHQKISDTQGGFESVPHAVLRNGVGHRQTYTHSPGSMCHHRCRGADGTSCRDQTVGGKDSERISLARFDVERRGWVESRSRTRRIGNAR